MKQATFYKHYQKSRIITNIYRERNFVFFIYFYEVFFVVAS